MQPEVPDVRTIAIEALIAHDVEPSEEAIALVIEGFSLGISEMVEDGTLEIEGVTSEGELTFVVPTIG